MPFRPPSAALCGLRSPAPIPHRPLRRRPFRAPIHATPVCRADDDDRTHYEVLGVPPDAPQPLIKKYAPAPPIRLHHNALPSRFAYQRYV